MSRGDPLGDPPEEDNLFTDTDDAAGQPGPSSDPGPLPPTSGPVEAALSTLTYAEGSAFGLGICPVLTALLVLPYDPTLSLVALASAGLLTASTAARSALPLGHVGANAHYLFAGQLAGAVLGSLWVALVTLAAAVGGVVA
ncbi:putative protein 2 [Haloarcula hispanica icosahedral virus 2]|uniref:Uncharacterized protein n=1 Tax=Haloarcula hispanica icosahedral virus 2 TaxID=1154689 RepID=H9AZV8_9VIRU|nr:putative protein 2 [Haloarcula hispanica icosahedral virus 2]AFD02283.1 putative protein 2 [Haloarcula hispanica icosahedral virus 2]